ncbi:hypothetical protein Lal_00049880 [Lupinus albus]|uniref:Uncharacterized protein n=1 Tax=Lupinus albus TaxID=3870 RepID=A0A6A4PN23_LUPAL|nr:hypothetical protein Lalb_Chr12g0205011 [Lupinus albus]KAF1867451.1 hypothetical protein Lal_00049880 [Lupinus albus]
MKSLAVLNLIDSIWFEHNILIKTSTSSILIPTSSSEKVDIKKHEESLSEPKLARIQINHTRSNSDQSLTSFKHGYYSVSPDSVLPFHKLQTILSGKEVTDSDPEKEELSAPPKKKNFTRRKRRGSKSLSDLEFEELKGFMDLGFVFTEEDKDSSLASIIPGLQRLGKKNEEVEDSNDDNESLIPRPYLSEAWEVLDERNKKENPLLNWKVPAINNETDMKDSLRLWAHTVASTVR